MSKKQKHFLKTKKGIVWPHLLELLVALLVLYFVIGAIFPEVFSKTRDIFGEFVDLVKPELFQKVEFKPYVPTLTEEEINVEDSMNALVCAINSVAAGREGWIGPNICPGTYTVSAPTGAITGFFAQITGMQTEELGGCSGVLYGGTCVECNNDGRFDCEIDGYQLPQDLSDPSLAENFIAGYGDPRYLAYYESFPEGADLFWQVDKTTVTTMAVGTVFAGGLLNILFHGKGKQVADATATGVKNSIKATAKAGTKEVVEIEKKLFLRLNVNGPANSVRGMFMESGLRKISGIGPKKADDITRTVLNKIGKAEGKESFEAIESSLIADLRPILKGIRKPSTFTGTAGEYQEKVLRDIISGTDDFIVEASDGSVMRGAKGIFQKRMTKAVVKNLLTEQTYNAFFRQFIIPTTVTREAVEAIVKSSDGLVTHEFDDVVVDIINKNIREGKLIEEGLSESLEQGIIKAMDDKLVSGGWPESFIKLFPSPGGSKAFASELGKKYLELGVSATYRLDNELIKKTALESLRSLLALPPNIREKALRQAADISTLYIEGATKGTAVKGALKGTIGTSATIGSTLDILKFPFKWTADQIPISFSKPKFSDMTLLGLPWLTRTVGKSAADLPTWVHHHKYPLMILLAVSVSASDAQSEKMQPVGVNSLALNQPTLLGPTKTYNLDEDVRKYFIRNKDRENDRLYLVSPCKTKLEVKKAQCDCVANPIYHRYDFGGGLQDVVPGSITINEEEIERVKNDEGTDFSSAVENFYTTLTDPRSQVGLETGIFGSTRTGDTLKGNFQRLDKFYDKTNAIKICNDRGTVENIKSFTFSTFSEDDLNNPYLYPKYHIDCLDIEIEKQEYEDNPNYCYDDFPTLKWLRVGLVGASIITDVVITGTSVVSGGATLPLLFATGIAAGVGEEAIAHHEKWP